MCLGIQHQCPEESLASMGHRGSDGIDVGKAPAFTAYFKPVQRGSNLALQGNAAAAGGGESGTEESVDQFFRVTEGFLPQLHQFILLTGQGKINPHT